MAFATTTAYVAGTVLTASALNNNNNAITNQLNGNVEAVNIAALAITTAKINTNAVTYVKLDTQIVQDATTVTAVSTDFLALADTSDSGKLKKALVSDILYVVPSGTILHSVTTPFTAIVTDTNHVPWTQPAISASAGSSAGTIPAYTPTSVLNKIRARATLRVGGGTSDNVTVFLVQAGAVVASSSMGILSNQSGVIHLEYITASAIGSLTPITFDVRFGQPSNTSFTNALAAGTQIHNGTELSSVTIEEVTP